MSGYYTAINTTINYGMFSKNVGYNAIIFSHNDISTAKLLFYGPHGPIILIPYVIFGNIIGWSGAAPLFIHMILLTIAFLFIYFCTISLRKTIFVQAAVLSFVPLVGLFFTTMMEIQMYAWGIILMAITYAYKNNPNRINHIGLLICIILASSVRITNVIFGIPYFVLIVCELYKEKNFTLVIFKKTIAGFITIASVYTVYRLVRTYLIARYKLSFLYNLTYTFNNIGEREAMKLFIEHAKISLASFFNLQDTPIFILMRFSVISFSLLCLLCAFVKFKKFKLKIHFNNELLFLSLILLSIAFLNILFYDIFGGRDFRVMATVFLSVVIYTIISYEKFRIITYVGVILCLTFLFSFNWASGVIKGNFGEFNHNEWVHHVQYNPIADNRYENTIVRAGGGDRYYDLNPGIGSMTALGSFSFDYVAELGVKYIIINKDRNDEIGDSYNIVATGDNWILYVLK